ncbi:MAG: putative PLP-dependent enzyme involved in cell wall biosis [Verrucomicrobiales bacterium]|nr:putative PLP-dependent enzyme involved in cell wall biosis [Verrucomicrobiales bacterium]
MKVPFVDLQSQYQGLKPQLDAAISKVIEESAFIRGRFVAAFEDEYSKAYGVKHCISVADGTAAIYIVLKMLGIGQGDEVITTANSWIASSETITQAGARVVFADVEKDYYNLDPDSVAQKITPRTKAILAVHLLGQPANLGKLSELCKKHNLLLIEDCAQSHFATYNGQKVGTFGIAATFSFYPGKNLGAYGDAGAIITNDNALADKCKTFARHGASSTNKHDHVMEGINSRLDGLQAAVLSVKLPHIHEWNAKRAKHASAYTRLLNEVPGIITPKIRENCSHIFHAYVIRVKNRDAVQEFLNKNGVATSIHYPTPLPLLKAYAYLGHNENDFPVASAYSKDMLSLPMYPELTDEMIQFVVDTVRKSVSG